MLRDLQKSLHLKCIYLLCHRYCKYIYNFYISSFIIFNLLIPFELGSLFIFIVYKKKDCHKKKSSILNAVFIHIYEILWCDFVQFLYFCIVMRFIVLITKKNYSILNREQRSTRSKFTIKSKKMSFPFTVLFLQPQISLKI